VSLWELLLEGKLAEVTAFLTHHGLIERARNFLGIVQLAVTQAQQAQQD
jgi:hypothetical protein